MKRLKEKLISKLVEYQKYKEITSYFKEYESKRKKIYISKIIIFIQDITNDFARKSN